jgi:SPP1 family predicted phage head-tail adaptor
MSLLHSKFIDSISGFATDTCTIQEYIITGKNSLGQETGEWQNKTGHIGIACCLGSTKDTEVKLPDRTRGISSHAVILLGYYPDVTKKMRAKVDEVTYDILGAVSDGYKNITHLDLEVVKL